MTNPKQSEAIPLDKQANLKDSFSLEGASPSSEGGSGVVVDGEEQKQYYPNGGW